MAAASTQGLALFAAIINLAAIPSLVFPIFRHWRWKPEVCTIESVKTEQLGDGSVHIPEVRYVYDGQIFQSFYRGMSGDDNFRAGDHRYVMVDPQHPDVFVMCRLRNLVLPLIAVGCFDAFFFARTVLV